MLRFTNHHLLIIFFLIFQSFFVFENFSFSFFSISFCLSIFCFGVVLRCHDVSTAYVGYADFRKFMVIGAILIGDTLIGAIGQVFWGYWKSRGYCEDLKYISKSPKTILHNNWKSFDWGDGRSTFQSHHQARFLVLFIFVLSITFFSFAFSEKVQARTVYSLNSFCGESNLYNNPALERFECCRNMS